MTSRRPPFTPHERRARLACALCAGTLLAVGLSAHAQRRCDGTRLRVLEARVERLQAASRHRSAAVEHLRRENAVLEMRLRTYERYEQRATLANREVGGSLPRGGGAPSRRDLPLPSRDMDPPTRAE